MKRGKIKIDGFWLDTWKYHREQGWKLVGITAKDTNGDYWLLLEKDDA